MRTDRNTHARSLVRRSGAGGFTLIETAMATVIIGVGVLALVEAQTAFLKSNTWTSQAATATYLAAQAVFVLVRLVRGSDVHWFAIFFNLSVVALAGLLGGVLGQRLRQRGFVPAHEREQETL